jgi:hypothetical protein
LELATSDSETEINEDFSVIESNIQSKTLKEIEKILSSNDLCLISKKIQKNSIPFVKVKKVISGGESGAETFSLKVAFDLGIKTGGTSQTFFMTEFGPNEDLKKIYKLKQCTDGDVFEVMNQNIKNSNVTIVFVNPQVKCKETSHAIEFAKSIKKELLIVELTEETLVDVEVSKIKEFLSEINQTIELNVSGHTESKCGFKRYPTLVYDILYDVLKPIYIPIDVISLVIESSIINTNPLLVKSMLHNYAMISKDWNEVCKEYMQFEFKYLHFNPQSYIDLQYTGNKLVNNWTIEFWLKKESTSNPSMSILNNLLGAFKLEQFPSQKVVGITLYHYYDEQFQTQLNENWNHVVFSSSKSGKLSLYINGDLKGVLDTNHLENFECPLGWIGGEGSKGSDGKVDFNQLRYGFVGDILEFKVWNTQRTNQEIKDEMFHVYPKHKNLILYMMFSDGKIYDYCSKNEMEFDGIEEKSVKLKDFK